MQLRQGRHSPHFIIVMLIGMGCAAAVSPLVTAKKVDPPPHSTADVFAPETRWSGDAAHSSHRKLVQIAVAKTGAPVYRFVECLHLRKEESKLVPVGISSEGLPVYRVKRGDYCLLTGTTGNVESNGLNLGASAIVPDANSGKSHTAPTSSRSDDVNRRLSPIQEYVCEKFGPACRVALAVQLAENAGGACEIYHYNSSDGTLDWGYFQINSVHLKNAGLNLKDLLDCKANVDYAYRLFLQKGFTPWTAYTSGAYRQFLAPPEDEPSFPRVARQLTIFSAIASQ
jgi:hypothetical protein